MGIIFGNAKRSAKGYKSLSAREVHSLLRKIEMSVIIDVRTRTEYESTTGTLPGSMLMPLHDLEDHLRELSQHKDKQIIVYCRAGHRSKEAARILSKDGFNVIDIDGGIEEWIMSDLPVNYNK
jgi:rhodanese-related sulfurtransferase